MCLTKPFNNQQLHFDLSIKFLMGSVDKNYEEKDSTWQLSEQMSRTY
jgi:hypothetical protein